MDFVVHIHARKDSVRVKNKNTMPFGSSTLIDIAIRKALKLFSQEQIYLNTNCETAISLAENYGIRTFNRSEDLYQDHATLDSITYDFMLRIRSDFVVHINTVTPLLQHEHLSQMIEVMKADAEMNSIVSGNRMRLHAFMEGVPINFDLAGAIPQTQNISSIDICNWGFGIWRSRSFIESYEKSRSGVFNKKFIIFDTPLSESLKISTPADFREAERLYRAIRL